jgi:glutamate-ammonia-ligase adenylyltransferase
MEELRSLAERLGTSLDGIRPEMENFVNPSTLLLRLERWLAATGNPGLYAATLDANPHRARAILTVFANSQALSDACVQNPELPTLFFEHELPELEFDRDSLIERGRRLVEFATSTTHALDRLRYLRQETQLILAAQDLTQSWPPARVWRGISDLAEAMIRLTLDVAWQKYAAEKGLADPCPLGVIGFGKLGSGELNYSSDIDLSYVIPDEVDDALEDHATRFAPQFGRALEQRMGRGALYRVDLRLRPFGSGGPIVARVRAVESYYRLYAEPWEILALLRAKCLVGSSDVRDRFAALRLERCFQGPPVSEFFIDSIREMRAHIDAHADAEDLKRGPGGIRDIEFVAQLGQLVHGRTHPALRYGSTLEVIEQLRVAGVIAAAVAQSLAADYTFLRQLEHRIQMHDDVQGHSLPESPMARAELAGAMGLRSGEELVRRLAEVRSRNRERFGAFFAQTHAAVPEPPDARDQLPARLREDADRFPELLEEVLSGEIAREERPTAFLETDPARLAHAYELRRRRIWTQFALGQLIEPGAALAKLADSVLLALDSDAVSRPAKVVALGSYGTQDLTWDSDLDLIFVVEEAADQSEAEIAVAGLLRRIHTLRNLGATIDVDARLRPDGGRGLLVRSWPALRHYLLHEAEPWELVALGHARDVRREGSVADQILRTIAERPLTKADRYDLRAMKRRIERERVPTGTEQRHLKLGKGTLNDIEWIVRMSELAHPGLPRPSARIEDRLSELTTAGVLNVVERDALAGALSFFRRLRAHLALEGDFDDVLPENPDRLARLATAMGMETGNELLRHYAEWSDQVRAIYQTTVEARWA